MTSPSRRNRRTIRSATIRAGWTSLAALGLALPVLAQSTPAPTQWKPHTPTQVQSPLVPPPVTVTDVPVMPGPLPIPDLTPPRPVVSAPPAALPVVRPVEVAPLQTEKMVFPPPPDIPATVPHVQPPLKVPVRPAVRENPRPVQPAVPVSIPQQQPVQYPTPPAAQQPLQYPIQTTLPAQPPTPAPGPAMKNPPMSAPLPPIATPRVTPASGLPNQEDLFRLDSDAVINQRILREIQEDYRRQDPPRQMDRMEFPPLPAMVKAGEPGSVYVPKTVNYSPMQALIEPNYVIHRRLFFEEQNSERAGWDAGPAQSVFSAAYFYRDVLLFASRATSHMKTCYDASPGKCRPGDATPYYYYPHGTTWLGRAVGCAFFTGMGFVVF